MNNAEAAESILAELGLNMTTAVNVFLKQTIRESGEMTVTAIAEGRRIAADPNVEGYKSLDDLREALDEV